MKNAAEAFETPLFPLRNDIDTRAGDTCVDSFPVQIPTNCERRFDDIVEAMAPTRSEHGAHAERR